MMQRNGEAQELKSAMKVHTISFFDIKSFIHKILSVSVLWTLLSQRNWNKK